jgi:hypothetical protein
LKAIAAESSSSKKVRSDSDGRSKNVRLLDAELKEYQGF